jgi:hypothetical protein
MKLRSIALVFLILPPVLRSQEYYAAHLTLASGYYSTFNNSSASPVDVGYFVLSNKTVLGAELHVKKISATIFSVPDVGITSITLSTYYGYYFSDDAVKPYIAGGVLVGFNGMNSDDVTRHRPDLIVKDNLAESFGLFVLAGTHYTVSNQISFFADYRIGVDYLYTYIENQSSEFVNIGGHYLRAGIRITLNSSEDW